VPIRPEDVRNIWVRGERIGVIVVPVMASEVQFLLVDEINEVRSVGAADFEGRFEWRFGRPTNHLGEIEEELRRLLEVGEYYR